ncbi:hypothetical protein HZA39_03050 [Candidatus Peregrinibacteria bacterium]|nr:hypothetical protein [Candidatus Peregrinibacteria bacterium]
MGEIKVDKNSDPSPDVYDDAVALGLAINYLTIEPPFGATDRKHLERAEKKRQELLAQKDIKPELKAVLGAAGEKIRKIMNEIDAAEKKSDPESEV